MALSLWAQSASAVVVRPGHGPAPNAFTVAWPPAGYRNVNHCGLVRISPVDAKPRHSLRNSPFFRPSPAQSSGLVGLRSQDRELRQRLATGQRAWTPSPLLRSSRPLRVHQGRVRPGWSRHWPIRPPPTRTL